MCFLSPKKYFKRPFFEKAKKQEKKSINFIRERKFADVEWLKSKHLPEKETFLSAQAFFAQLLNGKRNVVLIIRDLLAAHPS